MCCKCSSCKECVCVGQVLELLWVSKWKLEWSTLFLVFFSYVNSCLTSSDYNQLKDIWSKLLVNVIISEARVGSVSMNIVVINALFWILSDLRCCQLEASDSIKLYHERTLYASLPCKSIAQLTYSIEE